MKWKKQTAKQLRSRIMVCRILANGLRGIAADVGRLRWALASGLTPELIASLDAYQVELDAQARASENEAKALEDQATAKGQGA